jgi:hypothetical protein
MHRYIIMISFLLLAATARAGVTNTVSASNPVTDAYDQYSFTTGGTLDSGKDYSDNGGPPGQTFTTPSGSNFELVAFSFKGGGSADGSISLNGWGYRISSVSGSTLTPLKTGALSGPVTGLNSTSWLTFSFTGADVLTLLPDTQYAIEIYSDGRWWGIARDTDGSAYSGGNAFNSTSAGRSFDSTTINVRTWDRAFHVDLQVIPEPSSLALVGISAILFLGWRRRR